MREMLSRNPVVQFFCSVKLTVVCLLLLFFLTFFGTIDQVQHGLYLAQERFFFSFAFLLFGFIPFPGGQLVMWVMFLNLLCAAIFRLEYSWKRFGNIVVHLGILTVFVAAFVTFLCSQESHLTLKEGEASNVSSSYDHWEIASWKETGTKRNITAFDAKNLTPGQVLDFGSFKLKVKAYYPNSKAYTMKSHSSENSPILNASGIQSIVLAATDKEPARNIPGILFELPQENSQKIQVILFGGEDAPTQIKVGAQNYFLQLRTKKIPLPFTVKLVDFRMEKYPGTEVAKSYESSVEVETNGADRDVIISMNNPLRHNDFTFYQASYSIDSEGHESSTLAVVKNTGRILPYISSILTFLGLAIYFLCQLVDALKERKKKR